MPTYVYRREDGSTFEIEQSIKDDALTACPTTGQPVTRIIAGGTGLIFKGSGFYLTDYARKSDGNGASPKKVSGEDPGGSKESKQSTTSSGDKTAGSSSASGTPSSTPSGGKE